ncbi:hypothetical protein SEA_GOURDTHYMES_93 [Gordonia phage GourdThymes]|uniref:Uncharacterized protein n=14 Tax=Montyvirus TaxID=2733196 RepID=A0A2L1IVG8_9CAUD|nr:hypothetical protein BH763_gp036 [Gordonia phage Monty]YP_009301045.1 hypothetical protein BJD64_gp038 [Gordonia phage Hotorobo]YP_009795675.1 hypothetical protein HOS45_gp039 [Gordonia phage BirksAndSocks]YP_009797936.1 hypothetical protein HOS74_gp038 [Gordonia phage Flakey]YP_009837062.1 hypothetical protein HWB50_gp038 [Gordonia phage Adgers]YP_009843087.1 hypothetical protein HWC02_gp039 [Gordonia phage Sombrero]YP_009848376.1 hypothetical protein HWC39_gp038 [Gordonia phage Beaver]Y
MNKQKLLGFVLGASMIGAIWVAESSSAVMDNDPQQPTQVYVTEQVEVEVPRKASEECKWYLEEVDNLVDGQWELSLAKGRMKQMLDEMQVNVFTQDPFKIKELQGKMSSVQNQMNNAWVAIGDANSKLDRYKEDGNPCLK